MVFERSTTNAFITCLAEMRTGATIALSQAHGLGALKGNGTGAPARRSTGSSSIADS